jgi:hypothetical protein
VSLTPVANEKIFNQKNFNNFVGTPLDIVVDTGGKFAAGIVDTGGKFATGINNISEKFETVLMVYSGAWGKLIHEKNQ